MRKQAPYVFLGIALCLWLGTRTIEKYVRLRHADIAAFDRVYFSGERPGQALSAAQAKTRIRTILSDGDLEATLREQPACLCWHAEIMPVAPGSLFPVLAVLDEDASLRIYKAHITRKNSLVVAELDIEWQQ